MYSVQYVQYVRYVRYVQYVQYVLYSMYSMYCTVCAVCTVQHVLYSMYSMYSMYCTVCTVCTIQYVPSTEYQIYQVYTIYGQILTNIGHRFGHQSGLYESSGQNPAAILIAYSFRVIWCFQKYEQRANIRTNTYIFLQKRTCLKRGASLFKKQSACGKPVQP